MRWARCSVLRLLLLSLSLPLCPGLSPLLEAAESQTKASPEKPNILLIVADDLGYADLGIHGGNAVPTPHIDALARSGIRCTNGYVSCPYCSPTRAGMLTGRYQTRFGHEFNPHVGEEAQLGLPLDQVTIANRLQKLGYTTALFGKWHQGFSPAHHPQSRGFDEFFGFLVGGHNFLLHRDAKPVFGSAHSHDLIYRGREVQVLDGYTTDMFTAEAVQLITRQASNPWFVYLSYNAVHTPLEIEPRFQSRLPRDVTDPDRRGYLSLLLGLDDAIGRVLAHLKQQGQLERTLIFFLSDNGGSGRKPYFAYNTGINTPFRGDKGQTLEGGIRVPFFVSWPGRIRAGAIEDAPVIALDILPTSLAAAGQAVPDGLDGVNLLPYLTGKTQSGGESKPRPHEALYWRFGPQKAIRQGDWKLVDWRDHDAKQNSGWQLYDLRQDPGERNDLAAREPERVAALRRAWAEWDAQNIPPRWHGGVVEDPTAPAPRPKAKK